MFMEENLYPECNVNALFIYLGFPKLHLSLFIYWFYTCITHRSNAIEYTKEIKCGYTEKIAKPAMQLINLNASPYAMCWKAFEGQRTERWFGRRHVSVIVAAPCRMYPGLEDGPQDSRLAERIYKIPVEIGLVRWWYTLWWYINTILV